MTQPNFYTGNPLDRIANRRDDEAYLQALLDDPASRFVPVWRNQHLMRDAAAAGELRIGTPSRAEMGHDVAALAAHPWVLLGTLEGGGVFTVDLSALDAPHDVIDPALGRFEELRPLAPLLPGGDAAILAQARGLLHWRRNHRFCGHCGTATTPEQGGYRLGCPNCGLQHFPRTDPVVIMLVHHQGRALLARGTRFPGRRLFSALAGFVEPGESAEEAVAREVLEETGISVGRISYQSSQPWPYPGSLMLGFHAEATSTELTLDPEEIAEAYWLTPGEIRDAAARDIELPGATAIASRLLEGWLATQP